MIKLSENIAFFRKEKGITQEQLATELHVSNQAVSKWESGKCYPDIELLPDIANYFGISIDALLGKEIVEKTENIDSLMQSAIKITEGEEIIYSSLLQLKLSIGYNKARRIIDDMCKQGYITKDPTSKYAYLYVKK